MKSDIIEVCGDILMFHFVRKQQTEWREKVGRLIEKFCCKCQMTSQWRTLIEKKNRELKATCTWECFSLGQEEWYYY